MTDLVTAHGGSRCSYPPGAGSLPAPPSPALPTPARPPQVLEVLCLEAQLWDVVREAACIVVRETGPQHGDTDFFNEWLQCSAQVKRYPLMREVVRLMEELNVPRDFYTFQCLLERGPQSPEDVRDTIGQLQAQLEVGMVGSRNAVPTHRLLLRTYARMGDWDVVDQLVSELPPDPQVYETAVRLYGCVAKDIPKMERVMQHMKSQGHPPPPHHFPTEISSGQGPSLVICRGLLRTSTFADFC